MTRRPGPTPGVQRAPGGRAREFMGSKVSSGARALIQERANEECDGNLSEMVRRLLKYAVTRMPKGWS